MVFTEEDAKNDGRVKREAGQEAWRVASRNSGRLAQMFQNVCENEIGREPKNVLGDAILRALDDPDFSERLAKLDIDMSKIEQGRVSREDAEMVMDMAEAFGFNTDNNDKDFVDEIVMQRLKSKSGSPIPRLNNRQEDISNNDIQELKREIRDLKKTQGQQTTSSVEVDDSSVDSVFDDNPIEDTENNTETVEQEPTPEDNIDVGEDNISGETLDVSEVEEDPDPELAGSTNAVEEHTNE